MTAVNSKNEQINEETMEIIAHRVAEYKKNKDASQSNADEVNSHIGALSEVFDLDKGDVESIANDVLIKQKQQTSVKDKIYDGLIKYGKEVIIASIAVIIVSLFIFGRSSFQPQGDLSNTTRMVGEVDLKQFNQKATIAKVVAAISGIRINITEYYMFEGKYPLSLSQIGYENNFAKSKNIEGIKIGKEGSIIVKLKKAVGEDLVVKLSPQSMGGSLLEWQCNTNFSGYFHACEKASMKQELKMFN